MTNAMCLVLGGKGRACRPEVRAPRVATSPLADDEKPRSSGEASGHAHEQCGGRKDGVTLGAVAIGKGRSFGVGRRRAQIRAQGT
eukprot:1502924-Pleurochrysis_carterae.AAC.4